MLRNSILELEKIVDTTEQLKFASILNWIFSTDNNLFSKSLSANVHKTLHIVVKTVE